jgi:trehalose-6-phosphate synthase
MRTLVSLYTLHSPAVKSSAVFLVSRLILEDIFNTNSSTGRREILDGMLGANLVVFQKFSYGRHFSSSCVRVCGYENVHGGIDVSGQITRILHCSVGVDADRIAQDV